MKNFLLLIIVFLTFKVTNAQNEKYLISEIPQNLKENANTNICY